MSADINAICIYFVKNKNEGSKFVFIDITVIIEKISKLKQIPNIFSNKI